VACNYRLAIVVSHPVQYYAPWFAHLAQTEQIGALRIFYLWDFGMSGQTDRKFNQKVSWDVDLLSGYEYEWVPNLSRNPGTHKFTGLHNPELAPRIQKWNPDAVMVFGYGWRSLTSLAFCWQGSPLILRGDSNLLGAPIPSGIRGWVRRKILTHLFRRYDAFAAVGEANRIFYQFYGVQPSRIFDVPHAVDNDRFAASHQDRSVWRNQYGIPADVFVFLFAGKLEKKKRPDLLIGSGALLDQIKELAAKSSRVHILPFHNQSKMPAALQAVDTLVLPSQGHGETWGLIVNEAFAGGTPAIVSDHVGCAANLIQPGVTGWVFPAGNQTALQDCLNQAYHQVGSDREKFRNATCARIKDNNYTAATDGLLTILAAVAPRNKVLPP
jgi:glycosyltransferase involved in cell wall biosynthesis